MKVRIKHVMQENSPWDEGVEKAVHLTGKVVECVRYRPSQIFPGYGLLHYRAEGTDVYSAWPVSIEELTGGGKEDTMRQEVISGLRVVLRGLLCEPHTNREEELERVAQQIESLVKSVKEETIIETSYQVQEELKDRIDSIAFETSLRLRKEL